MPTITCSNDECRIDIKVNLSEIEIEDSQSSGNHTTQHSGSNTVKCKSCQTETEFTCAWDELDDTGEILSFEFT